MRRQAFFLDAPGGGRFCLVTRPSDVPLGGVLFLPPFAEEMNKSRRMAALGARAFAQRGWLVLQMDLLGCGDSAGDFAQASWSAWLDDVARGWDWLSAHCPAPRVLWTLRAGSLLAADWLAVREESPALLMWQPVTSGKQHLTQFLRLKAAGEMLVDSDARAAMQRVRDDLKAGRTVEVAGYALSAALAGGLDEAVLNLPSTYAAPVSLLEVSGNGRSDVSPAVQALQARWVAGGVPVSSAAVTGAAFWQTQEIETVPALIERSVAWFDERLR